MTFLDPIFNPVMLPILSFNPILGIIILALIITLIVTLAYKFFSNQEEMKRLKDKQKEFQDKMKSFKDKPEEANRLPRGPRKMVRPDFFEFVPRMFPEDVSSFYSKVNFPFITL